jgi:proline iminopeptidase
MRISVNDTTLHLDVDGSSLVPDGSAMREKPVLVVLHGPGFDHHYFKPGLSPLSVAAQLIYLDLRGDGSSDRPPIESCTLEQMADDVAAT